MNVLSLITVLFLLLTASKTEALQESALINACTISFSGQERQHQLALHQAFRAELQTDENVIALSCQLEEQSVFRFEQRELVFAEILDSNAGIKRLAASSPSYLLPAGTVEAQFLLQVHHQINTQFSLRSVEEAFQQSVLSNMIMSAFYGLCMVLILYVFFMGWIVGERSFQLYSLYVLCASSFFLLQEGQLTIFLPQYSFILGHYFYVLFAAFTVITATAFIVNVTEIQTMWPRITYSALYPLSGLVFIFACAMLIFDHNSISLFAGSAMAYITLLIMLIVLLMVAVQTWHRVDMAWLVLLSLVSMVFAMIVRLFPLIDEPFYQRYALIVAFAFEAFIFAIVVALRIQHIKQGKLLAENEAHTDALCDVLNRRGWRLKASDLIQQRIKHGGVLSLLYIDLDDFKRVNDTYGHDFGDKVLNINAKIIKNKVRTSDIVGRVGGDEFVVLGLFDSQQESYAIAQRLTQRLGKQILHLDGDTAVELSASVGHVVCSKANNIDELLNSADKQMYQVKRSKRLATNTVLA